MDHGQLSMVADKFQWVFSEALLNACGTDVKFYRRQRVITPLRLGLALTATCASQQVETIADFHCDFHALCGTTVTSKAFSNRVIKPHCADVAQTMAARPISNVTLKVLGVEQGRACGEFRHMVLQDGNSFAIHDGLREIVPGRFKVVTPAVVELHTTMDVLCDAPTTVVLTPETAKEQTFFPEPVSLRDAGLLADRGSIDLHSLRRRQAEDGCLLIRIVEGLMSTAIAAAALKRFVAHMTQRLAEVPLSTRKVALCAVHVCGDLVEALQHGDVAVLYTALEATITSLACHAQRAHPKRERHTGRSQLGLEPSLRMKTSSSGPRLLKYLPMYLHIP